MRTGYWKVEMVGGYVAPALVAHGRLVNIAAINTPVRADGRLAAVTEIDLAEWAALLEAHHNTCPECGANDEDTTVGLVGTEVYRVCGNCGEGWYN